jgi:hypothetical protein
MPDGKALRTLASMLGPGSQAFLFLDWAFGDPNNSDHNYLWHEQFATQLQTAWGTETSPSVYVEVGFDFKLHGGTFDNNTSEKLFGSQTGEADHLGRLSIPTPIRIYGAEHWNASPDGHYTKALCHAIIAELGDDALVLNPMVAYDSRMNVWLERAGATSDVYDQVVHIETWENGSPVIASITSLSPPEVRV